MVLSGGDVLATTAGPPWFVVSDIARTTVAGPARMLVSLAAIRSGGIVCSPDHSLLYVSDRATHWVYSYQFQADGSLAFGQRYYHLHAPDSADNAGAGALRVDRDGRLYVATRMGIQVCDQAGRVNVILPLPRAPLTPESFSMEADWRNSTASDPASHAPSPEVEFGGAEFDTLIATDGHRLYQRKLKVRGAPAFEPAHKPAAPKL